MTIIEDIKGRLTKPEAASQVETINKGWLPIVDECHRRALSHDLQYRIAHVRRHVTTPRQGDGEPGSVELVFRIEPNDEFAENLERDIVVRSQHTCEGCGGTGSYRDDKRAVLCAWCVNSYKG